MSQSNAKGKGVGSAALAAEERLLAFGRKKAKRCNAQSSRDVVDAEVVEGRPSKAEPVTPTLGGENQEEFTVEKIGKDDSRRRQKSLLVVRTPESLKGKLLPAADSGRPARKSKETDDHPKTARTAERKEKSGTGVPGKRKRSTEKMHMSIRGVKTHINVTLTSPLNRKKQYTTGTTSELQSNSEGGSATPAAPIWPQQTSKDRSECC